MITFGVELELCVNLPIKRFVNLLQSQQINITFSHSKTVSKNWTVMKDDSVLCSGKNRFGVSLKNIESTATNHTLKAMYPIEIVSPVLITYKSLSNFLTKLHRLNAIYTINQTQGFHIHLSNKYLQLPLIANVSFGTQWVAAFCVNWVVFEKLILSRHHPNRLSTPHARSLMDNLKYNNKIKEFNNLDLCNNTITLNYLISLFNPTRKNYGSTKIYPKGKYHNINLSNGRNSVVNLTNLQLNKVNRKGTIEIRSHEGTVNKQKIMSFVRFMKKFFIASYNPALNTFVDARVIVKEVTGYDFTKCDIHDLSKALDYYIT